MLDAILAQSRNTALIMGLIAMIGLLLQKKHATDVISGTMKTVIGFMVFNIGSSAMSGVVQTFTDLFNVDVYKRQPETIHPPASIQDESKEQLLPYTVQCLFSLRNIR